MNKFVAISLFVAVLLAVILTNKIGTQAGETMKKSVLLASIQEADHKECLGNMERFTNTVRKLLTAAEQRKVLEAQDLVNITTKGLGLVMDTCMYGIMTIPDHSEP